MSEKIADISFPDDDGPTIIDHSNLNLEKFILLVQEVLINNSEIKNGISIK